MLQVCVRQEELLDSEKEDSNSVCLSFEGKLLERVHLDYVCYRVKSYERAPLRCFRCQQYRCVAAVCRGVRRCRKDNCNVEMHIVDKAKCLHCEGNHDTGSAVSKKN